MKNLLIALLSLSLMLNLFLYSESYRHSEATLRCLVQEAQIFAKYTNLLNTKPSN